MTIVRTILLDNEAVNALRRPESPKHRHVLAHLEATVGRRRRGFHQRVLVPTAVRAEAGWDRTDPRAATLNRLGGHDHPLDTMAADAAAAIIRRTGLSVADAHLGAAASQLTGDIVVLTSDPEDIRRAADPVPVTVVRI